MNTKRLLLLLCCMFPATVFADADWSFTVLPVASIRYRGEGKILPQGYVNRFGGENSPVYRLEVSERPSPGGFWSLALWHSGQFGGGHYATETVPADITKSAYQTDQLNVGFTNLFLTYHRAFTGWPVEFLTDVSIVREVFKRKNFNVQGVQPGIDDTDELSAEGAGFGLAGRHGDRLYFRWRAAVDYYIQIYDSLTDPSAGHVFQAEGGLGVRLPGGFSVEAGALRQYWFILGQGNRRLSVAGTQGAVLSWNRQETRVSGAYLRVEHKFE